MIALGLLADPLIRYWRVISANPERGGMIPQAPRRPTGRQFITSRIVFGLGGEVAPGVAADSPVEPGGQEPAPYAERLERRDFLPFGWKPRQVGMLDHVVEREEAAHGHLGRGGPAVADVLGAEGAVGCAGRRSGTRGRCPGS